MYPDAILVIVGNKRDIVSEGPSIPFNERHYKVSVRAYYHIERPFRYIMRKLTGIWDLVYTVQIAASPPVVELQW